MVRWTTFCPPLPPTFQFRRFVDGCFGLVVVLLTCAFVNGCSKETAVWMLPIWFVFSDSFFLNRICRKHRSGYSKSYVPFGSHFDLLPSIFWSSSPLTAPKIHYRESLRFGSIVLQIRRPSTTLLASFRGGAVLFCLSIGQGSKDYNGLARNGVVNLLSLTTVRCWCWIRYHVGDWVYGY